MRAPPRRTLIALAVVLAPSLIACGDDGGTGPTNDTIVGSWVATSLTAPTRPEWGDAITGDGVSLGTTFTDAGSYSLSVGGDDPADPWICPGTASCSYSGTYRVSGNTLMFDEGTADEASASFSLSGGKLTITYAATVDITDPYKIVMQRP